MIEGFFKAEFTTPAGGGSGVVILSDGSVRGGDSMMYYQGTYSDDGTRFIANIRVDKHTNALGMASVFGRDSAQVDLSGPINGDIILAKGQSPDAPGVPLSVRLTRLG